MHLMASWMQCCCPRCDPTRRGCSEANTGVTGGICDSDNAMFGAWELEVAGLKVNEQFCEVAATCSNCQSFPGSGVYGPNTCQETTTNSRSRCQAHPITDINGNYLVTMSGCCQDGLLLTFDGDADDFYMCPSCGNPECIPAGASPPMRLKYMIDLQDHSGETDFPGPVGAKMCLFQTEFISDGCGHAHNHEDRIYLCNDIFRGVNSTLNCTDRNTWENEITSGDAITLEAGSHAGEIVAPLYYGGHCTIRPYCP